MTETAKPEISITDKLDMPLDEIAKLEKKKRQQERKEALKKSKAEKGAAAGGKKKETDKKRGNNKDDKTKQKDTKKRSRSESEKSDKKEESNRKTDLPPLTTGTPILVSNVDPEVDPAELKDIFQQVGPVKNVEILPPRRTMPAAARVTYKLKADAEKAVELFNSRELDGKTIKVKLSRKPGLETDKKETPKKREQEKKESNSSNKRQRKSSE